MDHSFPQASPQHHPKADDVCRFTGLYPRVHKFDTYQQTPQTQTRCVSGLPSPSYSNFNSAFTVVFTLTLSRSILLTIMWMRAPNVFMNRTYLACNIAFLTCTPSSTSFLPPLGNRPHPCPNENLGGDPLAIRSSFLVFILMSPWR